LAVCVSQGLPRNALVVSVSQGLPRNALVVCDFHGNYSSYTFQTIKYQPTCVNLVLLLLSRLVHVTFYILFTVYPLTNKL